MIDEVGCDQPPSLPRLNEVTIDVFHSYRSAYCYLLTLCLVSLAIMAKIGLTFCFHEYRSPLL